jgi:elongation factor P
MVEKKLMQYLYNSGDNYVFMNMETYEQIELNKTLLEDQIGYLKENLEVELVFFKEEMLGINLPEKIEMLVTSTEPATKGNTATTATKEAILETGLAVRVPLFINEGETIIISTSDGKYVSRK